MYYANQSSKLKHHYHTSSSSSSWQWYLLFLLVYHKSKRPVKVPKFAEIHINWTIEQWAADEGSMCLNGFDRRDRVNGRSEERFIQCYISKKKSPTDVSLFCSVIFYDGRTAFVLFGVIAVVWPLLDFLVEHVDSYDDMFNGGSYPGRIMSLVKGHHVLLFENGILPHPMLRSWRSLAPG